jgi:rhamnosyltransferase
VPMEEHCEGPERLHWFDMLSVVVPTLNAVVYWPSFASALLKCVPAKQVLILDSESTDGTRDLAREAGFAVQSVARKEFNHGTTRQLAVELLPESEIIVYLTQDAILTSPDAISRLLAPFEDPKVGAAYGRQLPRFGAGAIETHARNFNYPDISHLRDLASRETYGFKAIFISNSFAAYRRTALVKVGGFPANVIFGEDTITAAKLLLADYTVAYVANASVRHSHPHTWTQEFKRYFDIGVLHSREHWLLREFGRAGGEGKRFVFSELRHLWKSDLSQIPTAIVRTGLKFLGYRLGRLEAWIPTDVKRYLSMHYRFWDQSIKRPIT